MAMKKPWAGLLSKRLGVLGLRILWRERSRYLRKTDLLIEGEIAWGGGDGSTVSQTAEGGKRISRVIGLRGLFRSGFGAYL